MSQIHRKSAVVFGILIKKHPPIRFIRTGWAVLWWHYANGFKLVAAFMVQRKFARRFMACSISEI